jgi:hypothetical protein
MYARAKFTTTIVATESLSAAVDLQGYELRAIAFPSAWTAADVSLETSEDGVTYRPVFSGTAEAAVDAAASQWTVIPDDVAKGVGRYVKVRSGPSSAPVAQAADRTVELLGAATH